MEKYNYYEAIKEDVMFYILNNYTTDDIVEKLKKISEFHEKLYEDLYDEVTVTGGMEGYCDNFTAEEFLCHNLNLLLECSDDINMDLDFGASFCDTLVRRYLLDDVIGDVLYSLIKNG